MGERRTPRGGSRNPGILLGRQRTDPGRRLTQAFSAHKDKMDHLFATPSRPSPAVANDPAYGDEVVMSPTCATSNSRRAGRRRSSELQPLQGSGARGEPIGLDAE